MRLTVGVLALVGASWCCPFLSADPGVRPPRPPRKQLHDQLPGLHWDIKALEALGTIATTRYDTANNRIVWVLETEKLGKPPRIVPHYFDDEGSGLGTGFELEFTRLPPEKDDKKERVQVVLKLPEKQILKELFRTVLHKE